MLKQFANKIATQLYPSLLLLNVVISFIIKPIDKKGF